MITKVANLHDRSVRYLESGHGPTLVLIHAFPLNAEMWLPQLERAPIGWRVVAPDLRGFGGTTAATPGASTASIESHAADVFELMAHLEIDRAVIGGLSMGGYVALAMVHRAPQRVAGLVLANTRAGADSADGRAGRARLLGLVATEGVSAVVREMLPKLLGETTKREQPDLIDAVRALMEANSPDGVSAGIRALKDRPDRMSELSSIACPTLIVTGDEDVIISSAEAESMQRAIAGAELVVVPRVGHLSNLEAPLAFNDALAAWLGKDLGGHFTKRVK